MAGYTHKLDGLVSYPTDAASGCGVVQGRDPSNVDVRHSICVLGNLGQDEPLFSKLLGSGLLLSVPFGLQAYDVVHQTINVQSCLGD
ncbi:hypothetical protein PspLS_04251 [Pyricularia sp. CBS 133598]|nr:hypothetical protein PspLS_04251 [Pyricularia sp. CBS 133598]